MDSEPKYKESDIHRSQRDSQMHRLDWLREPKLQGKKNILLYKGLKRKVYRCYLKPLPAQAHTTKHEHITAAEETKTVSK